MAIISATSMITQFVCMYRDLANQVQIEFAPLTSPDHPLDHLDHPDHFDLLGHLDCLDHLDHLDHPAHLNDRDHLHENFDHSQPGRNQLDHLDHLYLDHLDRLYNLHNNLDHPQMETKPSSCNVPSLGTMQAAFLSSIARLFNAHGRLVCSTLYISQ